MNRSGTNGESSMNGGVGLRSALADTMAVCAQRFLDSLDGRQREVAEWAFPSDDERRLWFYTPTDHGGLALSEMTASQQRSAFQLVASGLSRAAYTTVSTIVGLDNILDEVEEWTMNWGRDRGRDPGRYYVRIFGDPVSGSSWSWRFGGHHVSLNHTIVDGAVASVTPCFLGADPASSLLLGPDRLRPLAGAEDYGRELVCSLTASQQKVAIVSAVAPADLVGGNRSALLDGALPPPIKDIWRRPFEGEDGVRVETIQRTLEQQLGLEAHHLEAVRFSSTPKGILASAMSAGQRKALRRLLDVYLRRMPDALAEEESAKFDGQRLEQLSFLWAGSLEPGIGHYYRIQGPKLVVEYDNVARNANHVHTVWRDPENDFGVGSLAAHYNESH
jgi:Protein of unknown function (DUF3500)